jgi:hypothetical protein
MSPDAMWLLVSTRSEIHILSTAALADSKLVKVRLAEASPTDGVQDTAATTGGRAGVQQMKPRIQLEVT